jgi:hypothetical protein
MRADRAVEPTKSENITETWRRSAVSCGATGASVAEVGRVVPCSFPGTLLRSSAFGHGLSQTFSWLRFGGFAALPRVGFRVLPPWLRAVDFLFPRVARFFR